MATRRILATLLAMCLLLSGCSLLSADPVQYAALAVVDGKPTAVVLTCGRPQVAVRVWTTDAADGTRYQWSVVVTVPEGESTIDVELLGAARRGWEFPPLPTAGDSRGRVPPTDPLTSFDEGREYSLDSSRPATESEPAAPVTFTTDDLTSIGDGEVLAATGDDNSAVISRESFVEDVRCD